MSSTNLDRALELVQIAIEEDKKQNYPEAYKQYQNALDYFMLALKYEKNERSKALIRDKIGEYHGRAEQLRDHIGLPSRQGELQPEEPNSTASATGSGTNLDHATDLVQIAIDEDKKQNYPEAYKQYQNALDYFVLALKFERNEQSKALIRGKIGEYRGRAEQLRDHIGLPSRQGELQPEEPNSTPSATSSGTNLDHAIDLVQIAIDEDKKQNYPEAYKQYQNALDYFMLALKYEKNERSKALVRGKIGEYLGRVEQLKDYLDRSFQEKRKARPRAIGANGVAHAGPDGGQASVNSQSL